MSKYHLIKKGFTLVELLVTITIIAILSTVAVISYTSFIEKSAVSVDNSLVSQLNIYTDAYIVKNRITQFKDKDVLIILDDSGINPIILKSEPYGYDLWFNFTYDKFELRNDSPYDENYIRVRDIEINDSIEDNNVGIIPPINEGDNNDNDITIEATTSKFALKDFGEVPQEINKNYVYGANNAIHVGIKIEDNKISPSNIEINNLIINRVNADGTTQTCQINDIFYQNKKVEGHTIQVSTTGTQHLKLIIIDPETQDNIEYTIPMYVRNYKYPDAQIVLLNTLTQKLTFDYSNNNFLNAIITLENTRKGIQITDYISPENYTRGTIDGTSFFQENSEIEIIINDIHQTIKQTEISNGSISLQFENIATSRDETTCTIIYRYFGFNGITVEKEVKLQ